MQAINKNAFTKGCEVILDKSNSGSGSNRSNQSPFL